MVKELPNGIILGKWDKLRGNNLIIAEMPHDDKGQRKPGESHQIVFRLKLKGQAEQKGDLVDQPETLEQIDTLKQKIINLQHKQDKIHANWWNIKEKQKLKQSKEEQLIDIEIASEKSKLLRELENKSVTISAFVVREYERVLFLSGGQLVGVISPGLYEIEEKYQNSTTEIIWVDITEFQLYWGLSRLEDQVITQDFATIGVSGIIHLVVKDPKSLLLNLISTSESLYQKDIEDQIMHRIKSSFKQIIQQFTIEGLLRIQREIEAAVRAELSDSLLKWGISVELITIENFIFPEEFQDLLDERFHASIERQRIELDHNQAKQKTSLKMDKLENDEVMAEKTTQLAIERKKRDFQAKSIDQDLEGKLKEKKELQKLEIERIEIQKAEIASKKANISRELKTENVMAEIDLEAIKAQSKLNLKEQEAQMQEKDKRRDYELEKLRIESHRDIEIAKKGSAKSSSESKNSKNQNKIQTLRQRIAQKEKKMDELDEMLMKDKISQSMHELRSKRLMDQIDELQQEIHILKDNN
ncbi:MAG: SPFH domain-containing protein [Promethearchaeota archaeon]